MSAPPLPLTSFQDHVAALDRTLERATGPVVLVGHAYAGAVVAATRSEKVKALAYVAALAPDEGETVAEVFYRVKPHPQAPQLAPDAHGLIYLPETAFAAPSRKTPLQGSWRCWPRSNGPSRPPASYGLRIPRITYSWADNDKAMIRHALDQMSASLDLVGARDVWRQEDDMNHLAGTARMGFTPTDSVIDADCRT